MIKAVIPVAGVGTRLRPHTHTQPKPLIPVAGMPILGHTIENLIQAGIKDFVFIIGHLGEKIEDFVRSRYAGQINLEFVVQSPRKGLGHAIWVAREPIQSAEEILIVLGDTIFDADIKTIMRAPFSTLAVQEVDLPQNFGVVKLDEDGFVASAVEKPKIPMSNLGMVGLYKIKEVNILIDSLDKIMQENPGDAKEYHLTDGLVKMLEAGVKIRTIQVEHWFDCGKKDALLETNRIMLERMKSFPEYEFHNCVIRPPVYISEGCQISNSIIGPYVAIDENAVIENSIITNSILGAYSHLDSIILANSVLGSDSALKGKAHAVNIGDNTEIDFND